LKRLRLGTALLERETLNLPDLVDILGQRPYPLKESIQEYLQELRERRDEEEKQENEEKEEKEEKANEENEEEESE